MLLRTLTELMCGREMSWLVVATPILYVPILAFQGLDKESQLANVRGSKQSKTTVRIQAAVPLGLVEEIFWPKICFHAAGASALRAQSLKSKLPTLRAIRLA